LKRAIFGGTFDPVHCAHLTVAREARARFGLDQVLIVPAASPPHKSTQTPFEHRFKMVELACDGDPYLHPSRVEEKRERSYSVLTIEELKAGWPEDHWFFLIGADAFAEIATWFRWREVVRMVDFIVVSRPGFRYDIPRGCRVHALDSLALDASSSGIRDRIRAGGPVAEVPARVLEYIRANRLYC
jgi:nicotinate-nucleotide adenylyltransferase